MVLAPPAVEDKNLPDRVHLNAMMEKRIAPPLAVRGNRKLTAAGMERLLIRGTNWIGDAVMTLPALASVRRTFPEARISVLAKSWVADVYRLCPHIDEVLVFESPGRHDGVLGKIRLARELHKSRFDAVILLQNAIEAAIIAGLARIPIRAGYNSDARGWLLTHSVQRTREIKTVHQTRYYLEMVKALGCADIPVEVQLEARKKSDPPVEAILDRYAIDREVLLIGLAPGATYGAAKKWFPERFAAVADRLADDRPARILLFGSAADQASTDRVRQHARHPVIDLAGKTTLREAIAVMARCHIFISNDSGLMHVAAALGVPTVAIFGSTNPVTTGPVGRRTVIVRRDAPCSPCLKTSCPTDFRCMEQLGVDDVYQAARRMMTE